MGVGYGGGKCKAKRVVVVGGEGGVGWPVGGIPLIELENIKIHVVLCDRN